MEKVLEQCFFCFPPQYAIGLWSIILFITSDDQLMKKLNDIACNLNWIQTQLKRIITNQCKSYIEKNLVILVLKKKTFKWNRSRKNCFHSSLLKNWLNRFQFGMIQMTTYEPKVVLPKPIPMNDHRNSIASKL